jgi:hypothetical protein
MRSSVSAGPVEGYRHRLGASKSLLRVVCPNLALNLRYLALDLHLI